MPRPRDPSIDRAVVDACVELLDEVGRAGLSRAAIARRAGVSLPAVNRRFASVDEVLLEIARTPMHAPGSLEEVPDLRSHLVAVFRRAARVLQRQGIRRSAAEMLAAAAGDDRIDAALQASLRDVRAETLAAVERARERGDVPSDADGELLLDLLNGAMYYKLLWRGERLTEAEVEPLVDRVLQSLGE